MTDEQDILFSCAEGFICDVCFANVCSPSLFFRCDWKDALHYCGIWDRLNRFTSISIVFFFSVDQSKTVVLVFFFLYLVFQLLAAGLLWCLICVSSSGCLLHGGSGVASSFRGLPAARCIVVLVLLLLCVVFRLSLQGGSGVASSLCGLPAARYEVVLVLLPLCVVFRLLAAGSFWCCFFFMWSSGCSLHSDSGVASSLRGLHAAHCMEVLVLFLFCVVFRLLAGRCMDVLVLLLLCVVLRLLAAGRFWCCYFLCVVFRLLAMG